MTLSPSLDHVRAIADACALRGLPALSIPRQLLEEPVALAVRGALAPRGPPPRVSAEAPELSFQRLLAPSLGGSHRQSPPALPAASGALRRAVTPWRPPVGDSELDARRHAPSSPGRRRWSVRSRCPSSTWASPADVRGGDSRGEDDGAGAASEPGTMVGRIVRRGARSGTACGVGTEPEDGYHRLTVTVTIPHPERGARQATRSGSSSSATHVLTRRTTQSDSSR